MEMRRFAGRGVLITGGASGIGAAVAERFALEGARVALLDLQADLLERQAAALRARGASVATAQADVSDEQGAAAAIDQLAANLERLDIVVHCAGIVGKSNTPAAEFPVAEFRRVVDINLTGSFIVCRHSLPHMLKNGYGRILLFASMAGKDGNPGMSGYVASKAGIIGLVKALGKEYALSGITINALAPAVIATPMNAATDPETVRQLTEKIPMKRLGTVAEAAAIACWICSEEATFNTGAVFDLSGGRATY
jgi:NAD(P)-dependent dehydrogenase (short-subunit alcohol dehydrogenase family)